MLDTSVSPITAGDWHDITSFTDPPCRRFVEYGSRRLCVIRPIDQLGAQYEIDGYTIISINDLQNGYMEMVYRRKEPHHA